MNEYEKILFHFFAGYFHQDWKLDDATWQDVVSRFVSDDGKEAAERVRTAVNKLLVEVESDVQLTRVVADFGCYYWAGSPSEMRVWLENLNAKLQAHQA